MTRDEYGRRWDVAFVAPETNQLGPGSLDKGHVESPFLRTPVDHVSLYHSPEAQALEHKKEVSVAGRLDVGVFKPVNAVVRDLHLLFSLFDCLGRLGRPSMPQTAE